MQGSPAATDGGTAPRAETIVEEADPSFWERFKQAPMDTTTSWLGDMADAVLKKGLEPSEQGAFEQQEQAYGALSQEERERAGVDGPPDIAGGFQEAVSDSGERITEEVSREAIYVLGTKGLGKGLSGARRSAPAAKPGWLGRAIEKGRSIVRSLRDRIRGLRGKKSTPTGIPPGGGRSVGRWSPRDVAGRTVYQGQDLFDPAKRSAWQHPVTGQWKRGTNIQRMADGRAPKGHDGKSINLHHLGQKEPGTMVEVPSSLHDKMPHKLRGPGESFRNDPVLKQQYEEFRMEYWKQRSQEFQTGQ